MHAVRTEPQGVAGPDEGISPFHAEMAVRFERDGVLRRPASGGYLVAVRDGDMPAIEALGPAAVERREGVNLVRMGTFADVLLAEMRCTFLSFPEDFEDGHAPGEPAAGAGPGAAAGAPSHAQALMDTLALAIEGGLAEIFARPAPGAGSPPAGMSEQVRAQLARDLPEIERIMREAGLAA